jgi:serine protease Do
MMPAARRASRRAAPDTDRSMGFPTDAELCEHAESLGERFRSNHHTLVTAESCTGGWIAKTVTDRLMSGQAIQRGYLGVQIQNLPDEYRAPLGLSADQEGAYVADVTPGGPAAQAGLRAGDIVVAINGESIETSTELTRRVGQASPGETLRLEIIREERRQTVNVRSGTRPADVNAGQTGADEGQDAQPDRPVAPSGEAVEGMTLAPLSEALRSRFSIPETVRGLVITAAVPTSRAGRAGVEPGFVIVQANGRPVSTVAELRAVVLFNPPYSPHMNPVETYFKRLKTHVRRAWPTDR